MATKKAFDAFVLGCVRTKGKCLISSPGVLHNFFLENCIRVRATKQNGEADNMQYMGQVSLSHVYLNTLRREPYWFSWCSALFLVLCFAPSEDWYALCSSS